MKLIIILLTALLTAFNISAEEKKTVELKFGSVAQDVPAKMIERLTPMMDYLNKKTKYNISIHPSPNMTETIDALGNNTTQIAYLTPAAYIQAREKYQVEPLVSFLENGRGYFKLVIVVKKDSNIKSVKDLKGKKFAFGDKKAKLQPATVIRSGLKLGDFSAYEYLNHYDNIAKAVLNNDFDGGVVLESVAKKFEKDGLRIIYSSDPLPSHVIAVNKSLDPKITLKLKNAFLSLKPKKTEDKKIIQAFEPGYDGLQKTNDKNYNIVRALSKLTD